MNFLIKKGVGVPSQVRPVSNNQPIRSNIKPFPNVLRPDTRSTFSPRPYLNNDLKNRMVAQSYIKSHQLQHVERPSSFTTSPAPVTREIVNAWVDALQAKLEGKFPDLKQMSQILYVPDRPDGQYVVCLRPSDAQAQVKLNSMLVDSSMLSELPDNVKLAVLPNPSSQAAILSRILDQLGCSGCGYLLKQGDEAVGSSLNLPLASSSTKLREKERNAIFTEAEILQYVDGLQSLYPELEGLSTFNYSVHPKVHSNGKHVVCIHLPANYPNARLFSIDPTTLSNFPSDINFVIVPHGSNEAFINRFIQSRGADPMQTTEWQGAGQSVEASQHVPQTISTAGEGKINVHQRSTNDPAEQFTAPLNQPAVSFAPHLRSSITSNTDRAFSDGEDQSRAETPSGARTDQLGEIQKKGTSNSLDPSTAPLFRDCTETQLLELMDRLERTDSRFTGIKYGTCMFYPKSTPSGTDVLTVHMPPEMTGLNSRDISSVLAQIHPNQANSKLRVIVLPYDWSDRSKFIEWQRAYGFNASEGKVVWDPYKNEDRRQAAQSAPKSRVHGFRDLEIGNSEIYGPNSSNKPKVFTGPGNSVVEKETLLKPVQDSLRSFAKLIQNTSNIGEQRKAAYRCMQDLKENLIHPSGEVSSIEVSRVKISPDGKLQGHFTLIGKDDSVHSIDLRECFSKEEWDEICKYTSLTAEWKPGYVVSNLPKERDLAASKLEEFNEVLFDSEQYSAFRNLLLDIERRDPVYNGLCNRSIAYTYPKKDGAMKSFVLIKLPPENKLSKNFRMEWNTHLPNNGLGKTQLLVVPHNWMDSVQLEGYAEKYGFDPKQPTLVWDPSKQGQSDAHAGSKSTFHLFGGAGHRTGASTA